jgi:hypothetical protein
MSHPDPEDPMTNQILISGVSQNDFLDPKNESLEFEESLRNDFGSLRVRKIRDSYFYDGLDVDLAISYVVDWKNTIEYLVLKRPYAYIQKSLYGSKTTYVTGDFEYKGIKASKRGNDVYQYHISELLRPLLEVEDNVFFGENGRKKTRLLFMVLTYDANRCSFGDAWKNVGFEYNSFRSNIVKQYGKVSIFRTWEASDRKFPHVNLLVYFHDHEFEVFDHIAVKGKNKGKQTFRLSYSEMKKISGYWHSFVDVSGCRELKSAIKEITKYITEDLCSGSKKGDLTMALLSLFGKQAYAISRDFGKVVCGIDGNLSEPFDLNKEMCNSNFENGKWEFVGILPNSIVGFGEKIWEVEFKHPPPKVLDAIKLLDLKRRLA